MTFEEFFEKVAATEKEKPNWRPGQAMFNTLLDVRTDVADLIRGTKNDPFHVQDMKDARLGNFIAYIQRFFPSEAGEIKLSQ